MAGTQIQAPPVPVNGNGGALVDQRGLQTGAGIVEQERALAEVKAAVQLAKLFPRDMVQVRDRIIRACQDPELAEHAIYSYPRGDTQVTGPTIRLAEAIAREWGNLRIETRTVYSCDEYADMEVIAWDIETNVRESRSFRVSHSRTSRAQGTYRLTDPRDIYEAEANFASRRRRACILAIIPGNVVANAVSACMKTLTAQADTSPEAQAKIVKAFAGKGVSKKALESYLGRPIEQVTAMQVVDLKSVMNAIKDGAPITDWFDVEEAKEGQSRTDSVKDKLAQKPKAPAQESAADEGAADKAEDPQASTAASDASEPAKPEQVAAAKATPQPAKEPAPQSPGVKQAMYDHIARVFGTTPEGETAAVNWLGEQGYEGTVNMSDAQASQVVELLKELPDYIDPFKSDEEGAQQ